MKHKIQYLKDKGMKSCPWCNTKDKNWMPDLIGLTNPAETGEEAFVDYSVKGEILIYQEWKCNICNKSWRDIYRLSDVVSIPKQSQNNHKEEQS